ncbi:MAG: hypothetical protein N2C14_11670, partial [Planctomycetales bacterium]
YTKIKAQIRDEDGGIFHAKVIQPWGSSNAVWVVVISIVVDQSFRVYACGVSGDLLGGDDIARDWSQKALAYRRTTWPSTIE